MGYSDLSNREREIMLLLVQGNRVTEIAKRLRLDYKTVMEISKNIKNKLEVTTVAEMAEIAEQNTVQ